MVQINIRMDDELRRKTEQVLIDFGLNMSSAVNIFAHQIVRTQSIPFPLTNADGIGSDRYNAAREFIEFAKTRPVKLEQGYSFNRDECYAK